MAAASSGTRLKVGVVGQVFAAEFRLLKIALDGDPSAVRAELIAKAAAALNVTSSVNLSTVKMFLSGGALIDDVSMLEKDDTVWFAFDGGGWVDPGAAVATGGGSLTSRPVAMPSTGSASACSGVGGGNALTATFSTVPPSPSKPNAGFKGAKPVRPSSARQASSASLGKAAPPAVLAASGSSAGMGHLEARGANPRRAFDRPLGLPATMCTMPIGPGPMPSRPISAHSYSLSRPRPRGSDLPAQAGAAMYQEPVPHQQPRAAGGSPPRPRTPGRFEGSKVKQREAKLAAEWEASGFVPPDVAVAPTKPRAKGGAWGREVRMDQTHSHNVGSKNIVDHPWGISRPTQVFDGRPGSRPRAAGAQQAVGTRPRGPLQPANPSGNQLLGAGPAPRGGAGEFVIEATCATNVGTLR